MAAMSGERRRADSGLTVLDATALVIGAAVASVHIRGPLLDRASGVVWGLVGLTFLGLATSAAGPFVCLARRTLGRGGTAPGPGEGLWIVMGLPWVVAAAFRGLGGPDLADFALGPSLALACALAVVVVYRKWVIAPPTAAAERSGGPWTNRMGLALAVAWPVQWMFYLMVLSNRVEGLPPGG